MEFIGLELFQVRLIRIHILPSRNNFHDDPTFAGYKTGSDLSATMFFSWVNYIYQIADGIPLVVVNEPIFISTGRNSNVRYDSFYPRWAYDQYRAIMNSDSSADRWNYVDLWNIISAAGFSDTALHLSPVGEQKLAAALIQLFRKIAYHERNFAMSDNQTYNEFHIKN